MLETQIDSFMYNDSSLNEIRSYGVKKARDRQMAPSGRGAASPWLRLVALCCGWLRGHVVGPGF